MSVLPLSPVASKEYYGIGTRINDTSSHFSTDDRQRPKDHRYRHHDAGLKPGAGDAKFTAAQALNNADSWAMFCMDCAGRMSSGDYAKVQVA